MSASDNGRPVTVVTLLPARPLTSRPTRTAFALAAPGAPFGQTQSRTGWRQLGHKLPIPVEYTILAAIGTIMPGNARGEGSLDVRCDAAGRQGRIAA